MTDKQTEEAVKAQRRQFLVDVMREALRRGGPALMAVLDRFRARGAKHSDLVELAGRAGYSAAEFDEAVCQAEEPGAYE